MVESFKKILNDGALKKFLAVIFLVIVLLTFRSMMDLLLFTFIFSYLFYNAEDFLYSKISKLMKINRKIVISFVYLVFVALLVLFFYKYIPVITKQIGIIAKQLTDFDLSVLKSKLDPRIFAIVGDIDASEYFKKGGNFLLEAVTNIGKIGLNIFLALILSLFLSLEREEVSEFGKKFEKSKVAFFYNYYKYFFRNFLGSFSKVMQTQLLIAIINSVLSVISLAILGFPQVLGLGFMIFILGLIPVAGVVISLVPLSIIAFKLGGIIKIIYVLVMIIVLHALESYVLNPKLMSMRTKLPVFFTFVVLIASEHLLGIWGLLIGLPLFIFFLDMFGIMGKTDVSEPVEIIREDPET